jgi:hypothetical protein
VFHPIIDIRRGTRTRPDLPDGSERRINKCVSGLSPKCPGYFDDDRTVPICDYCGREIEKMRKAYYDGVPNGNLPKGFSRLKKAMEKPVTMKIGGVPQQTGDLNIIRTRKNSRRVIV